MVCVITPFLLAKQHETVNIVVLQPIPGDKMKQQSTTTVLIVIAIMTLVTGIGILVMNIENSNASSALQPDNTALVKSGKELYISYCASCHGKNLEGQPDWRSRNAEGKLPAPPHDETGHTWHHADELLFKITKFGTAAIAGEDYKTDMPGYKDQLSDKEIIAVLSYIKSTWPANIRKRHDQINARAKLRE